MNNYFGTAGAAAAARVRRDCPVEAMRRAFADRAEHLGDPDFNPGIPIDRLISKEFAKAKFENITI